MTPIDTGSELIPEAHQDGEAVYCRLADDLTVKTAPWAKVVFGKLIKDYSPQNLVLDLKDVGFIDSAGLATLVLARKLMPGGGKITLQHMSDPVRGLIKIAHLDQLFAFDDAGSPASEA